MMNLCNTSQLQISDIYQIKFDILICASGQEKRGPYFASKYSRNINVKSKVVFCYTDRPLLRNSENLNQFNKLNFKLIDAFGNQNEIITNYLVEMTEQLNSPMNILVDYSSMTKVWYGCIINFFSKRSFKQPVSVFFTYSPSVYEKQEEELPNTYIDLVPGFSTLNLPDLNTALLIGLGYEKIRATGLIEFLDLSYDNIYLFHTSNEYNAKFSKDVTANNSEIIKNVGANNVISFDLNDMKRTEAMLLTLSSKLIINNRVAIAPLGPKPFSLISMVIAKKIEGINIFRVGAGEQGTPPLRRPDTSKNPIIYCLDFRT